LYVAQVAAGEQNIIVKVFLSLPVLTTRSSQHR